MEDLVARVGGSRGAYTLLVKDTVACSGAFLIHYMVTKLLAADSKSRVVLLGLSEPFSHYNRIARRQGCSLQSWSDKGRFTFVGLSPEVFSCCGQNANAGQGESNSQLRPSESSFISLYLQIRDLVRKTPAQDHATGLDGVQTCVLIDDVSVLEVIAGGVQDVVLDFVHYLQALSWGKGRCSLMMLAHRDVHESWPADPSPLGLELEHVSDAVVTVEPLATGLAADVHGQITLLHRRERYEDIVAQGAPSPRLQRFQFRALENGVQFFLPGRTAVP